MERMTVRELALHFADDFHDWIDGDDPVEEQASECTRDDEISIWVKFESGAQFIVSIKEVYE